MTQDPSQEKASTTERDDVLDILEDVFEKRGGASVALKEVLGSTRPEDVADALALLQPLQRLAIYRALPEEMREVVVEEADPVVTEQLLRDLKTEELIDLVEDMSPDDAADVLLELSEAVRPVVMKGVEDADPDLAEDLRVLIRYAPDTAGGMMTTEFVSISENATAGSAIAAIQGAADAETISVIYVLNTRDQLVGVVSIRELLLNKPETKVEEFMQTELISVTVTEDQGHAAALLARYNLQVLPIVDDHNVLRGIITVDDVIDALQEEFDEDLFRLAGTATPEYVNESVMVKSKKRLPWLLVTLALGMALAFVLSFWEALLESNAKLSFFLPVLAAMAGSASIQASTLVVRALSTDELGTDEIWRLLWVEARVGLSIGSVCALAVFLCAWLFASASFALVVALGMFFGIINATVLGTAIPMFFHRIQIDPALSAGPFITALNDVVSLIIYLTFAGTILGLGHHGG